MRAEFLQFIREQQLLSPGDSITCAVSGGADSMCLLALLCSVRQELRLCLSCAHYNHGLREEASEDEAFVRQFCSEHGVPFYCEQGAVASDALPGESLEMAARRLRYDFLLQAAKGGLLATAHTADDNLETLLLHLTRGTSMRGMGGIPVKQGAMIRPLLFATRDRIMQYLQDEGIAYREDSTNSQDFCPRNRIRHHVVPLLRAENPQISASALRLSLTAREEDAYLSELAKTALDACRIPEGYDCRALRTMPKVLLRRSLYAILQQCGLAVPTRRHYALLHSLVFSSHPSARAQFPGGIELVRRYDLLRISEKQALTISPTPLAIPGITHIPEAGIKIITTELKKTEKVENSPIQFLLSCDMIGDVVVRSRRTGDSIRLPGGSRSLKRLMVDRKIPASRRGLIPVLADEAGVLAVCSIGANLNRIAQSGDRALRIQIQKEDMEYEW